MMPLDMLPDLVNDATHVELDKAVTDGVGSVVSHLRSEDTMLLQTLLISQIVAGSSDGLNLDKKFIFMNEANELVCAHPELREMLSTAWARKSYRDIRNLAILRAPGKKSTRTTIAHASVLNMAESFRAQYRGVATNGFCEYLTHSEELFQNSEGPGYYAKFCSIVQSSGTGKSRMLTELSKNGVVVIYMNLRSVQDDSGFPIRDPIPSQILTTFSPTKWGYQTVCYAFFIALFETLHAYLVSTHENVMDWVCNMCEMCEAPGSPVRTEFFDKVYVEYMKITGNHVNKGSEGLSKLSLSGDDKKDDHSHQLTKDLLNAYRKMAASLENIFSDMESAGLGSQREEYDRKYRPKLVIALDEAHPLTEDRGEGEKKYRPANEVCGVANRYSHDEKQATVWLVFASTTSKVSDFSLPDKQYDSARVADNGQKLFPPYTLLGWDQFAPVMEDTDIKDVSQLRHIIGYGRPLWASLKISLRDPTIVFATARYKLRGAEHFDPRKTNHVLAVLAQRFAVNITLRHPDSVAHLEKGVASHLRICLATSLDRNWRFTSYPSEPFLSCMAAIELHATPKNLVCAMETLLKVVNSGMIDAGQRGELASRLLWLLAKDFYLRSKEKEKQADLPKWDDEILDCQMIPVVDWLEFVFGKHVWDTQPSLSLAREVFKDAYLNFSHWICMETFIRSGIKKELSLDGWTRCHWQRTSAVQCCRQQPLVEKVIPIYFKGGPGQETALVESRMSQIFISDKARQSKGGFADLHNITRLDKSISDNTSSGSLPYIAILADLGQPPLLSATFPEKDVSDRCLRIYAAGCDKTTYPFLGKHAELANALRVLVHLQQIPEPETPSGVPQVPDKSWDSLALCHLLGRVF